MSTDVINSDGIVIATPSGRMAEKEAKELRNSILPHLTEGNRSLLIDFSGVDYMTSSALGVVIALLQKVRSSGGGMAIAAPDDRIHMLLEVAGLHQLLSLCRSRPEAESRLRGEESQA